MFFYKSKTVICIKGILCYCNPLCQWELGLNKIAFCLFWHFCNFAGGYISFFAKQLVFSSINFKGPQEISERIFIADKDVPNLLVFPPNTDMHHHQLYRSGKVFLQDKVSFLLKIFLLSSLAKYRCL